MRRTGPGLFLALALVAVATGCGSAKKTETELGPPRQRVEFGHIESLARSGGHFVLRFDPAWFLSGRTANDAAAEDGAVEPGQPVPNDNYVVEEGHRLLTYVVADDAHVTVLTRGGDPAQMGATSISVSQLAQIVHGTSHIELFEPLESGIWITVGVDAVRSIDQQYRP